MKAAHVAASTTAAAIIAEAMAAPAVQVCISSFRRPGPSVRSFARFVPGTRFLAARAHVSDCVPLSCRGISRFFQRSCLV